jgi:CubicO group peptidase (beta-lactamase class C family)
MSAGKPITAAAMLKLVSRGLITLDTRVIDVWPDFGAAGKHAITLRHLLTHTAGCRGPLNNFTPGPWDAIAARVAALRQEPGWAAGEKAGYHIGSTWFALGEIIRRIDGRSVDRFVADEVFAPLQIEAYIGMSDATYERVLPRLHPLTSTETHTSGAEPFAGNTRDATITPRPGANARGPVRSLGKFYESLLFDDRVLCEDWRTRMTSPQRVGLHDHTFRCVLDWGLGVLINSAHYAGEHAYGYGPHAGPRTFGHGGNQCGAGFADPDRKLVVAWSLDGMPGEPAHQARAREINRVIYESI